MSRGFSGGGQTNKINYQYSKLRLSWFILDNRILIFLVYVYFLLWVDHCFYSIDPKACAKIAGVLNKAY